MEAKVVLGKCPKNKKTYGVRIQKGYDGEWYRTWAFEIKDKVAENEGYEKSSLMGALYKTQDYPGCPYCGTHRFGTCGYCNKMFCYNNEQELYCPWCGELLKSFVEAETFDITTDTF